MVLAEKLVTAVQRGTANTRWRDFADVYLLTHTQLAVYCCWSVGSSSVDVDMICLLATLGASSAPASTVE